MLANGTSSVGNYQALLQTVGFQSTSNNPTDFGTSPQRALTWTVSDGTVATTVTTTVNIAAVNDAPVETVDANAAYTEKAAPVTISPGATASDVDNVNLVSGVVRIVLGGFDGDVLTVNGLQSGTFSGIDFSYDAGLRALVFTHPATVADYQAFMQAVEFSSTSENPTNFGNNPTRTLRWGLSDGNNYSAAAQSTEIVISAINDPAVLSTDVRNLTETNAAADISTSATLTISDIDSPATFVAQAGTVSAYGTFAIDSAGTWTYTASSAHNEFVAGTTYTDTFQVASADGTLTSVTINILGTDDAAVPEFNGDNKDDIVWQHDNGTAAVWLMDGTSSTFVGAVGPFNPGPSWQIKGTGDFNGDGKSDIIWQGDNGAVSMWLMDGTNTTFVGAVGPFNPGPSWQIKGTGDFNGDCKSDIIWQGDNGAVSTWLMDGTNATFVGTVGSNPGPSWQIKGTGDFNGDGKSDIIWLGDSGAVSMWLMDGTNATCVGTVGSNPGPSWQIKDTGDFNGDGKADILWQGQDGTPAIWLMDGTNVTFAGTVGPFNPGSAWDAIV